MIEKRSQDRQQEEDGPAAEAVQGRVPAVHDPELCWDGLPLVAPDATLLERNLVISAGRNHPSHTSFDMLRTRLLQALSEHGWSRVAVTAPTRGCGSSFAAANLAFSVARLDGVRSILMDLDLRAPSLKDMLGLKPRGDMREYLHGLVAPEEFLLRARRNLAVGLTGGSSHDGAELFHDTMTGDVLDEVQDLLDPDLILFDLPPALEHDDVLAILPHVDTVLVVAGAGRTTADDIIKVEQTLGEVKPILGVMLNRADGSLG